MSWLLFAQIIVLLVVTALLAFVVISYWHESAVDADSERRKRWSE